MTETLAPLVGLFVSALLSATILPGSSEVLLVALIAGGTPAVSAGVVATVGNTLGSLITYWIGLGLVTVSPRLPRSMRPDAAQLARAEAWFSRYGVWALLFAWLPVVGDALALIAGVLRVRPALFLVLVAIGKAFRYAVVILFTLQFSAPLG
ncbi:MAG: DedA family protein [Pseudomonadaceae bacterium]|nr:DedA family protein [Pseudomonadaceae bacterium]